MKIGLQLNEIEDKATEHYHALKEIWKEIINICYVMRRCLKLLSIEKK